jgi:hypothetical protein
LGKLFQDHFGVIDLETLGVGSDSAILSLGLTVGRYDTALSFEQLIQGGLYLKFDLKEQLQEGRKKSDRVIKWWYDQPQAARKVLIPSPDDISLYRVEEYLKRYFDGLGIDIKKVDLYDRNSFDLTKLQYLFEEDLNQDVPWNYHYTFDIPTAFRFMGFERYAGMRAEDVPGCIYHNALHDAALDHLRIYKVLHDEQR